MTFSPVSARARSELLHAEVAYLLRHAGVPTLHIKGPTVALWLYDEGERPWGDVDILVPPSRIDEALATLQAAGFNERYPGVNRHTSEDHAVTMAQADPDSPDAVVAEIDVHHRFVGIDLDPERAFDRIWRRREPAKLANIDVWFPDIATRALLIALNTARSDTAQARGDLTRMIAAGDSEDWRDVIALATRLDALPGLRAGLELEPAGRVVIASTELAHIRVSPEWSLRVAGAPRTALRLEELARLPWRRRPFAILRWLLPPPAIIRMRDPRAQGGLIRLAGGYVRRFRDGITAIGPSVRALAGLRGSTKPGEPESPVEQSTP